MEVTVASVQSIPHPTTVTEQPNRVLRWWMRHYRHIGLASMAGTAILVCVIAVILLPIILHKKSKENEECASVTVSSTESTIATTESSILSTTITNSYTSSATTQTVSMDPLCAENATWKSQAVTVAGSPNAVNSDSPANFDSPVDILIDTSGNLFVADCYNYRVVYWPVNATEGRTVAGIDTYGSWINSFKCAAGIVAWNNQLYVSDIGNYRVLAFPLSTREGSPDGLTIVGRYGEGSAINQITSVYYMAINRISESLYLSDSGNDRILKLNLTDNTLQLIAGTGIYGSDNVSLNFPLGITINETTGSLYVTDSQNHRIQKFDFNSAEGITVAGGNSYGHNLSQLYYPSGVAIDSDDNVYIADSGNNRIIQWLVGAKEGRIIAGTGFADTNNTQLDNPVQLKFDIHYNLYVVDQFNNRIQRFDLLDNGC